MLELPTHFLRPQYICIILLFFSVELQAQNDNSVFIISMGTPNNELVRPLGCNGKFWLSITQQVGGGDGFLAPDQWWWERYPMGSAISNNLKYNLGELKVNDWDLKGLTPTFSGAHYYLEVKNIEESDYGDYRFVVMNVSYRSEIVTLKKPEEEIYCSNPVSFGARKEYISEGIDVTGWQGDTSSLNDNVLMVGPFRATTGNPRERYQITQYYINAIYDLRSDETGADFCKRFGYNFKLQIFDVSEDICANKVSGQVCARVVQQQAIVFPLDAINDKQGTTYPFYSSYYSSAATGMGDDWTAQPIPVWNSLGPLLISPGQYMGLSTGGCIAFKRGPSSFYSNLPSQKSYTAQTPLTQWTFSQLDGNFKDESFAQLQARVDNGETITIDSTFRTAEILPLNVASEPLTERTGPFSFSFDAEFYDVAPEKFEPTAPPRKEDTTSPILGIVLAILLICCLCISCIMCFIAEKNRKSGRERKMFQMKTMLDSCNISSETGERLPPGWFEEKSPPPNEVPYYYNPVTKESMWDIPCFG